jgi:membrane protein implicated in regulation of membrane protease activity
MEWWIWLVSAVVLFGVELLTPGGFYFFFFGLGALGAGLLSLAGVDNLLVQSIVFLAVSIGAVVFLRKPLMIRFGPDGRAREVDSLVGESAVLSEALHPGDFGHAELRGSSWKVRNIGSVSLAAGQRCIVEQVDGLTLHVRAAQ